jgi:hypothetical protein
MDDIVTILDICEHLDGIHETVLYVNTAGNTSSYVRLIDELDIAFCDDIPF